MPSDSIEILVDRVTAQKKAWILSVAILGVEVPKRDLTIPGYWMGTKKDLKVHSDDLDSDLKTFSILETWTSKTARKAIPWLASKYDAWVAAKCDFFDVGRIHEIEQTIGRLKLRRSIDCPPYAQLLLQGFLGAAVRHPEYHLVKDLALLCNLYLDSEAIADQHLAQKTSHTTESNQSLARSTILTCYNLLESFVSGLVVGFLLDHPDTPEPLRQSLEKPDRKRSSLSARFEDVPSLISGKASAMSAHKNVLDPLFGEFKWRRDAFVHCEPGNLPNKWNQVKEDQFHDVSRSIVLENVRLTLRAIEAAWSVVHKSPRPRWLLQPDETGRFPKIDAKLRFPIPT